MQAALRLFCLRKGIAANDCRGRLSALQKAGFIPAEKAQALEEALSLLLSLLLSSQMEAVKLGRSPDGWVDRRQLSEMQLTLLKQSLIEIRSLQKMSATH
ncbi:MAG: hypothetical protein LRY63_13665 [Nitrincola sp.]|nr:hypothetical protein [Nitrincola sp.]